MGSLFLWEGDGEIFYFCCVRFSIFFCCAPASFSFRFLFRVFFCFVMFVVFLKTSWFRRFIDREQGWPPKKDKSFD